MGLQSSRTTAAGEHQGQYGSTAGLRDPFAEESTDVLRRRAEHLLDEMMLGAVDAGGEQAGAGEGAGGEQQAAAVAGKRLRMRHGVDVGASRLSDVPSVAAARSRDPAAARCSTFLAPAPAGLNSD